MAGAGSPIVLALVAGFALLVPSAQARVNTSSRPDLVVVSAKLTSKRWGFIDGQQTFAWHDVTRNAGAGRTPVSHTGIRITALHARLGHAGVTAIRRVPVLGPNGLNSGGRLETHKRGGGPLGAYRVEVCADALDDIPESNEHNNCKAVGNFYIGRRQWKGFLHNRLDYGGTATEFFYSPSISVFKFAGYADGRFGYNFTGAIQWDETGVDTDNCTYSGTGTISTPPGPSAPTGA